MTTRLDVHTHLIPPLPDDALTAVGLRRLPTGAIAVEESPIGPPALYDPSALIRWLDRSDRTEALVSIPPPLYRQGRSADVTKTWTAHLNDALAASLTPWDRLHPLPYLPFDHPAVAAEVIDRRRDSPPAGYTACAGGRSLSLADPEFDGVWSRLVACDAPLFLHPGRTPDPRLDEFYLHNLVGNPLETAVAAAQLLLGGALTRFPSLRVVLAHGGGALPSLIGRLQRGVDTARPGVPSDLDLHGQAQRLWIDDLTHDPGVLALASGLVGEAHVLHGSDWPFPMGSIT